MEVDCQNLIDRTTGPRRVSQILTLTLVYFVRFVVEIKNLNKKINSPVYFAPAILYIKFF